MPMGKGTYGSKRGRPAKKKKDKIEIQKKKFTTLILLTPWFQKIINSLLASYLIKV